MTAGLILVRTASSTVLPVPFTARSIAPGTIKFERDIRFIGSNQGQHYIFNIAASQVVRFQLIGAEIDTCFYSGDPGVNDGSRFYFPQPHGDQGEEFNAGVGYSGSNVNADKTTEGNKNAQEDEN